MFRLSLTQQHWIFFFLTLLAAIAIGIPSLNFQDLLSVGDHGRDLYAGVAVYRGDLPFKDFWWVYGPLMPYFYGFFNLVLGEKITSILFAKFILKIAGAGLFYCAARVIMNPWWAFLAAFWFVGSQADFFFTYNHIGGISLTIGMMWMGLNFLKTQRLHFAWGALGFIAVLGLVKINFACSAGAALGLVFILNWITVSETRKNIFNSHHKLFYLAALIGLPLLWFGIYMYFLRGLSFAEIRQCLPYLGGDQPYNFPPSKTIPYYFAQHWQTILHNWASFTSIFNSLTKNFALFNNLTFLLFFLNGFLGICLHVLWHLSTVCACCIHALAQSKAQHKRLFWASLIFLLGFFVLNFHEFVVSAVWYRSYWTQPMLVMFHFLTLSSVAAFAPRFCGWIMSFVLCSILTIGLIALYQTNPAKKVQAQFLTNARAGIYVGNEPAWVDTVNHVGEYLNSNLKPGEQFFALPYDGLYYYLTNTKTPTRQLIFFDHIKIEPQQELSIIKELELHHTAYVLLSNRIASSETGLGIFGKSYCPLLYQYVMDHFAPVYKYGGDWNAEPGWGNNHGVIIFKRK